MESKQMEIQFAEGGAGLLYQYEQLYGNFGWSLSGSTLSAEFSNGTQAWEINIDGDTLTWTYTETEVTGNVTSRYESVYTAVRVK
jgi:hypothetical protein